MQGKTKSVNSVSDATISLQTPPQLTSAASFWKWPIVGHSPLDRARDSQKENTKKGKIELNGIKVKKVAGNNGPAG